MDGAPDMIKTLELDQQHPLNNVCQSQKRVGEDDILPNDKKKHCQDNEASDHKDNDASSSLECKKESFTWDDIPDDSDTEQELLEPEQGLLEPEQQLLEPEQEEGARKPDQERKPTDPEQQPAANSLHDENSSPRDAIPLEEAAISPEVDAIFTEVESRFSWQQYATISTQLGRHIEIWKQRKEAHSRMLAYARNRISSYLSCNPVMVDPAKLIKSKQRIPVADRFVDLATFWILRAEWQVIQLHHLAANIRHHERAIQHYRQMLQNNQGAQEETKTNLQNAKEMCLQEKQAILQLMDDIHNSF